MLSYVTRGVESYVRPWLQWYHRPLFSFLHYSFSLGILWKCKYIILYSIFSMAHPWVFWWGGSGTLSLAWLHRVGGRQVEITLAGVNGVKPRKLSAKFSDSSSLVSILKHKNACHKTGYTLKFLWNVLLPSLYVILGRGGGTSDVYAQACVKEFWIVVTSCQGGALYRCPVTCEALVHMVVV